MLKSIAAMLVAFALGGCATVDLSTRREILPENLFLLDVLGNDPGGPIRPRRTIATEKPIDLASSMASSDDDAALAALPKYSKEWVARYAAKQAADDARLARVMVICRGC